jgi:hypothetical protein
MSLATVSLPQVRLMLLTSQHCWSSERPCQRRAEHDLCAEVKLPSCVNLCHEHQVAKGSLDSKLHQWRCRTSNAPWILHPYARAEVAAEEPPRLLVAKPGFDGQSCSAERIAVAARVLGLVLGCATGSLAE